MGTALRGRILGGSRGLELVKDGGNVALGDVVVMGYVWGDVMCCMGAGCVCYGG